MPLAFSFILRRQSSQHPGDADSTLIMQTKLLVLAAIGGIVSVSAGQSRGDWLSKTRCEGAPPGTLLCVSASSCLTPIAQIVLANPIRSSLMCPTPSAVIQVGLSSSLSLLA